MSLFYFSLGFAVLVGYGALVHKIVQGIFKDDPESDEVLPAYVAVGLFAPVMGGAILFGLSMLAIEIGHAIARWAGLD